MAKQIAAKKEMITRSETVQIAVMGLALRPDDQRSLFFVFFLGFLLRQKECEAFLHEAGEKGNIERTGIALAGLEGNGER